VVASGWDVILRRSILIVLVVDDVVEDDFEKNSDPVPRLFGDGAVKKVLAQVACAVPTREADFHISSASILCGSSSIMRDTAAVAVAVLVLVALTFRIMGASSSIVMHCRN